MDQNQILDLTFSFLPLSLLGCHTAPVLMARFSALNPPPPLPSSPKMKASVCKLRHSPCSGGSGLGPCRPHLLPDHPRDSAFSHSLLTQWSAILLPLQWALTLPCLVTCPPRTSSHWLITCSSSSTPSCGYFPSGYNFFDFYVHMSLYHLLATARKLPLFTRKQA